MYLGNLRAADDFKTLKQNGITHILTAAMGLEPQNTKVKIISNTISDFHLKFISKIILVGF